GHSVLGSISRSLSVNSLPLFRALHRAFLSRRVTFERWAGERYVVEEIEKGYRMIPSSVIAVGSEDHEFRTDDFAWGIAVVIIDRPFSKPFAGEQPRETVKHVEISFGI